MGFEDAPHKDVSFSRGLPSWNRRGGRDLKKNVAKHPLKGADGVVAHGKAVGMLFQRFSVSDHPGASRHPSCTRRGARASRTVLVNRTAMVLDLIEFGNQKTRGVFRGVRLLTNELDEIGMILDAVEIRLCPGGLFPSRM